MITDAILLDRDDTLWSNNLYKKKFLAKNSSLFAEGGIG